MGMFTFWRGGHRSSPRCIPTIRTSDKGAISSASNSARPAELSERLGQTTETEGSRATLTPIIGVVVHHERTQHIVRNRAPHGYYSCRARFADQLAVVPGNQYAIANTEHDGYTVNAHVMRGSARNMAGASGTDAG